jgi:hypothetical protein
MINDCRRLVPLSVIITGPKLTLRMVKGGMNNCEQYLSHYTEAWKYILFTTHIFIVSCGVRDKINEYHLSLSSMDVVGGD